MAATEQGRHRNDLGPIGERVRRNVRQLREARGLSTRDLSALMGEAGRPIQPTAITKIESGARRVDVGDLAAFAVVLGVSPLTLLLPGERADDEVQLTPERSSRWEAAWRWATGEQPLLEPGEQLKLTDPRVRKFIEENRPYEHRPVDEAARFLTAREYTPFSATIRHDGTNGRARLTYGDVEVEDSSDG